MNTNTNASENTKTRMWMVRSAGGSLYDIFAERGVAAVGWRQLAAHAKPGVKREELIAVYQEAEPLTKHSTVVSGASQVWRFVNEIKDGDWIVTYSPANRLYLVGKVCGPVEYHPEWAEQDLFLTRKVKWEEQELQRDKLSDSAKNSLGSVLTVFKLPSDIAAQMLAVLKGNPVPVIKEDDADAAIVDPLADIEAQALERIKDLIGELGWDDMQQLVAGILRAMGYKTQVSALGSDRGKDIIASPDGFGFEHPRIIVEVKHRKEKMDSQEIRSFLGGRHKDDRGLYVSTGGFTKDALYESERAAIPLVMWTLDHVARALIEHYDAADAETKSIIPLKRLYWLV